MKFILAILVPLLLPLIAAPQTGSQDPRFTVKMQEDPEDSIESKFTITNQSQIPITAVIIACDRRVPAGRPPGYVRYQTDSVIDDSLQIAYQESSNFIVRLPDFVSMTCKQDSSVRALLFADGSSFGETEWVNEILQRRQSAWKSIGDLQDLLQNAKNSGTTKSQLAAQFLQIERGPHPLKMPDHTVEPEGDLSIYQDVSRTLAYASGYAKDSPISQPLVDELSEQLLDLRQILLYSKPAIPGLPQNPNSAAPPPDFTIKFPHGLDPGGEFSVGNMVSVFYTLSGQGQKERTLYDRFGPDNDDDDETVKIHTLIAGHPVSNLKVAAYAPGCQIKIFNLSDPYAHSGTENFECIKLPTIKFAGQILPSELLFGKKYRIQILLHNPGDNETSWFEVYLTDDIAPDENGRFQIEIPDFSQDPICSSRDVTLQFFAGAFPVGTATAANLSAENGAADSNGNLHLTSDYGGPVIFQPRPKEK